MCNTGHEMLPEFTLINRYACLYDPALMQFLSPDPLVQHGSAYAYCSNNPLKYIDPTGMRTKFNGIYKYRKGGEDGGPISLEPNGSCGTMYGDYGNWVRDYVKSYSSDANSWQSNDNSNTFLSWLTAQIVPVNSIEEAYAALGLEMPNAEEDAVKEGLTPENGGVIYDKGEFEAFMYNKARNGELDPKTGLPKEVGAFEVYNKNTRSVEYHILPWINNSSSESSTYWSIQSGYDVIGQHHTHPLSSTPGSSDMRRYHENYIPVNVYGADGSHYRYSSRFSNGNMAYIGINGLFAVERIR